jgi:undecaprenyl-diphosphatase
MTGIIDSIQATDLRLFSRLQQYHGWLARHCRGVSRTADGPLYVLVALAYIFVAWKFNPGTDMRFVKLLCLCFLIERPVYFLLKQTCRRRRPPQAIPGFESLITASDKFSFPSGHTSAAFMFAVVCLISAGPVAMPLFLWASAVGFSRIFLGVHFPTDVVIGACLGSVIAFQCHTLMI